jgi:quaternary ammonium compound-resistance protein SugE
MAWVLLFIAGIAEVVWAVAMKQSDGFSRVWPTVITFGFMAISVYLLGLSMRTIPLGTAYVIWTGIGAVGAFVVGLFYFHEPASALRLLAAALIVSGLVLMKITSQT